MSAKKRENAPPAASRRSTRSTRGSVKPIVDLTKSELSDHEEETISKSKSKREVIDDEEFEPSDDEDEPKSKKKGAIKKQPAAMSKKKQTTAKGSKSAATKKGVKSADIDEKPIRAEQVEENIEDHEAINVYYELSEKEMKEVNNAFNLNCPSGAEEVLDSDSLKTAIRSSGFEPRADEIHKLLKKFANKTGKVNRDCFHRIMAFKLGSAPGTNDNILSDEISKVFNLLDLDKTGMITLDNLRSISKELNEEITDEELIEMIAEADIDGDSMINKQEFFNIMKKTSLY